jgi:hypothetical protein
MLRLIVDGHYLTLEDSLQYIEQRLKETFQNIVEFSNEESVLNSDYWGECELLGNENDYSQWIMKIAEKIFND